MTDPAPGSPGRSRAPRPAGAALLTVLLGSVGVGPLLIYGLSATSDRVITDLGISEAQFGLVATACFASAAVSTALLARFADRRSDMALMAFIFITGALALIAASIPGGFALLLGAAVLSGVAQSFPNGVTNRIIVERVPASRRMGWVGVKQSGVQVAQLVSSVAFPLVAVLMGWRGAALIIACVPVVLLLMCWTVLRRTPRLNPTAPVPVVHTTDDDGDSASPTPRHAPHSARPKSTPPSPASLSPAARRPPVLWALAAFGMLNGIAMQAANVYMPLFAVRELGFSLVMGGVAAAVAGLVGVAARVGWARVMARGASGPLLMLGLSCTALTSSAAFLAAHLLGAPGLLWAAVVLHGASALGVSVVLMGSVMRLMPATSIASASGMVTSGMFLGFALGPVGMGLLVALPGGFLLGWAAVAGVYLACVLLAGVLLWRTRRTRS